MRILVVEDEKPLAEAIVESLRDESYAVDLALDGQRASELMVVYDYDLVVLDWTIPPPTGIELLRAWREEGFDLPVLMLTGRVEVEDRVDGLDTGADDYLTKPFSLTELLARIRSLLRRRTRKPEAILVVADLELRRTSREVMLTGKPIDLSSKEFALLEYLLLRRGEAVTRAEIAEHVWDDGFDPLSNVIDVTVYRLRKKIDGKPGNKLLHTLQGVGYILKSEPC